MSGLLCRRRSTDSSLHDRRRSASRPAATAEQPCRWSSPCTGESDSSKARTWKTTSAFAPWPKREASCTAIRVASQEQAGGSLPRPTIPTRNRASPTSPIPMMWPTCGVSSRRSAGNSGVDTVVTRYTKCGPAGALELWTINGAGHMPTLSTNFGPCVIDWFFAHPKP